MDKKIIFGLIVLVLILTGACADEKSGLEKEKMESQLDSLQMVLEEEKTRSDSLKTALHLKIQQTEGYPVFFGNKYQDIEDPKKAIEAALRKNPELIPIQPVLGGEMDFRKIEILSEQWLLAIYDDGHIQGKAIYEYQLQPNGTFAFTLVATQEP